MAVGGPAAAQAVPPKVVTALVDSLLVRVVLDDGLSNAEFEERQRLTRDTIAGGIVTALANYPLGASSAGLVYVSQPGADPVLKSTSFGPFFVERSMTNGRGNLNLGVSTSRRRSTSSRASILKNAGFPNQSATGVYADGSGVGDACFAKLDVKSRFVFSGSHGATDALDIGWAVPVASLSVRGQLLREYDAGKDYDRPSDPGRWRSHDQ
jgi:hypothetical protein